MPNLTQVNDWFRAAAEVEAKTPITVGGTTAPEGSLSEQGGMNWGGLAFAKLVEFRRRQSRLSPEELASQANVALNDVLSIERGVALIPAPCIRSRSCSNCPSAGSLNSRDSWRPKTNASGRQPCSLPLARSHSRSFAPRNSKHSKNT